MHTLRFAVLGALLASIITLTVGSAHADAATTHGQVVIPLPGSRTAEATSSAGVVVDSKGRIIVAGHVDSHWVVMRLLASGKRDRSFSRDGIATVRAWSKAGTLSGVTGLAVDRAGRVLLTGTTSRGLTVVRLTSRGARDTKFSGDGVYSRRGLDAGGVTVARGKILLTGSGKPEGVLTMRLNHNGTLDRSYGGGSGMVTSRYFSDATIGDNPYLGASGRELHVAADGTITVLGGIWRGIGSGSTVVLEQYDWAGEPTSFAGGEERYDFADGRPSGAGLAVAADGTVYLTGAVMNDVLLARHAPGGHVDRWRRLNFRGGDEHGWAGALDAQGRYVAVGFERRSGFVARRQGGSSLAADRSFSGDGRLTFRVRGYTQTHANGVAIDAKGRIVVGGIAERSYGESDALYVRRYRANGKLDTSFRTRR